EFTEEELARAIRIDPSQIAGFSPSIDALIAMLLERKRKILETYETESVQTLAERNVRDTAKSIRPPKKFRDRFETAVRHQQLYDLERIWYSVANDQSQFAVELVQIMERMGEKYEVDELAARYLFTGHTALTVSQAIAVKEELQKIDELLKQLEEARDTAQIGIIDMDMLSEFAQPGEMENLEALQQMVQNYTKEMAERQGLEQKGGAFQLTPKAYRMFQGKLLERIFSNLQASRSGRHQGPIVGEGAVELPQTKQYEFGDSLTNMDIPQTFVNAMLRSGPGLPIRIKADDIEVHRTKNNPKSATVVIMDMSGSMRYEGQYINVKRMALAMDGLIRSEYPGDYLQFIEMYTFAKLRPAAEIINLMPKPVTIHDPWVHLKADMSRDDISESMIHPHFTNIQHSLQLARQLLSVQDSPNRQIVLITDGLPTAHFEKNWLYMLYPPDPRTEEATMREAMLCHRENITINMFLIPSWSQSEEDIRFAYNVAETTSGRVFFTAGKDLDRFVVWDYLNRKREIIG
ncbi:MAG: hypothetical protein KDA87_17065, partial [Planctomycetales bacterium]|nr:hypothetical protein [Planctomycetales bacterium]